MKKTYIILLLLLTFSINIFGQVGINTENPKQTFHVDGQKDNPATGNPTETQQLNDVVITENGQIGVGINEPTQKLDVKGTARIREKAMIGTDWPNGGALSVRNNVEADNIATFVNSDNLFKAVLLNNGNLGIGTSSPTAKIHTISTVEYDAFQMQDGSEGEGKFLASNKDGKATWVNSPLTPVVFGDLDTTSDLFNLGADQYVRDKITLTKGRWLVYVGKLLSPASNPSPSNNVWVRLTLSSSQTSNEQSGFAFLSSQLVSGWLESVGGPNRFTFLSGVIAIEVTSTSRTLYLRTREYNTVGSNPPTVRTRGSFGENYLFAVPTY